jgi:hypothetical protein
MLDILLVICGTLTLASALALLLGRKEKSLLEQIPELVQGITPEVNEIVTLSGTILPGTLCLEFGRDLYCNFWEGTSALRGSEICRLQCWHKNISVDLLFEDGEVKLPSLCLNDPRRAVYSKILSSVQTQVDRYIEACSDTQAN